MPPSWGLVTNSTSIIRSDPMLLFMYVIILKFDFGDFGEGMVSSLTIWTLSYFENASYFSCNVDIYDVFLVRGKSKICCDVLVWGIYMLYSFFDKNWQKAESMASNHFWILRMVSP